MILPINCPICSCELALWFDIYNQYKILKCSAKNHEFSISKNISDGEICSISIFGEIGAMYWNFKKRKFRISKLQQNPLMDLPFFEPDFSDFNKLKNKIQTYLTFL